LASLLDGVIIRQATLSESVFWLVLLSVALVLRATIVSLKGMQGAHASKAIRTNLRTQLLETILSGGPSLRARFTTGGLAHCVVEQVEALDPYYARYRPQLITVMVVPVMLVIAIGATNWLAGLMVLLSAPFIPLFMALIGMGAQQLSMEQQKSLDRLSGVFYDRLSGLPTINRLGFANQEAKRLEGHSEAFRQRTMKVLKVAFLSSAVLEFFSALAIAVMAIYIGFSLLGFIQIGPSDELTLRTGLFMLLLAPEFYNPLRTLGQFWHDRSSALAAAESLQTLQKEPPARTEPISQSAFAHLPSPPTTLRTHNLTVGPTQDIAVLKGVDFEVLPGQCQLIIGPSGSGKSTLLNALAGFRAPVAGTIFYGDAPIETLGRSELNLYRAWLGQRVHLIAGTLRENLAYAKPQSDPAMAQALTWAGLGSWLKLQNQGLDLEIGPDGLGMSRGQLQRLALARLFLDPKPILLLDEPTTGLDAETELAVWSALRDLANRSQVAIVACSHSALAPDWSDSTWEIQQGSLIKR